MGTQNLMQDVKIETAKGGVAAGGALYSVLTLNEWVAVATLIYIVIQIAILGHKHFWAIKDRRKDAKTD